MIDIETFKVVSPYLTFVLGMGAVGFVESLKDRHKSKKLYKLFESEINDECSLLKVRILNAFTQIKGIEHLLELICSDKPPKNVEGLDTFPNKIDTSIIEKNYHEFAHMMSRDNRLALKKMIENNNYMNAWIDELMSLDYNEDGFRQKLHIYKRYTMTLIMVRYSMILLTNKGSPLKKPGQLTKQEIIDATATELCINMTIADLTSTVTGTFNSQS